MQHAHMGFLVIAEEQAKFDRGADAQRQSAIPSRIRKSPTASGRFSPNPAGKAAVLVEIEESWVSLVELRLKEKGGIVFRRFRDDQLLQAEAALEKSLERLEERARQRERGEPGSNPAQHAGCETSAQGGPGAGKGGDRPEEG